MEMVNGYVDTWSLKNFMLFDWKECSNVTSDILQYDQMS